MPRRRAGEAFKFSQPPAKGPAWWYVYGSGGGSANESPVRSKQSWKMSGGIVLGTQTKFVAAEKSILRGKLPDRRKARLGMALSRMPGDAGEAAEELIANYGADAETVAAGQADTMLELGDLEAFEAWTAVAAAIRARRDGDFLAAG